MHIALTLASLGAGGAERVITLLARHWIAAGHRVTIICFDQPDDLVFHPLDPAVDVVRLGLPPVRNGRQHLVARLVVRRVAAMRAALKAAAPDLVISFLFKVNIITLLAGRGLDVPIAVSERNHPSMQPASPFWSRMRRITYPSAKLLILQTEASRQALPPALRARGHVIPNPILRYERRPEPPGAKILAAVGRLDTQKGFDMLLEAWAMVQDRHPDWSLSIWGIGPNQPALSEQIDRLGLAGRASLRGLSANSADWIAAASAFVLSSRYEGFGNALAEAMAAGLPVVAFDCEFGPGEMITHGQDGLLVPPGDVPALAESISSLLANRDLRDRLGPAASRSATRYAADAVLQHWDAVLPLMVPTSYASGNKEVSLPTRGSVNDRTLGP